MPHRGLAFCKEEEIDLFHALMEEAYTIPLMGWRDVEQRHQEKYGSKDHTKGSKSILVVGANR